MNILYISEHYLPKISGTVTYVEKILENVIIADTQKNNNITFIYPAEKDEVYLKDGVKMVAIKCECDILIFPAAYRYEFVEKINRYISENINNIDLVHVLFGLFITEKLDLQLLKKHNIKSVVTVHNIPPQECSVSWKGDVFHRYLFDNFRKELVRIVNKRRLKKNLFDLYIVPSKPVADLLRKVLPIADIETLGHGIDVKSTFADTKENLSDKIKILTVGGFVPHKNQAIIPNIAKLLKQNRLDFEWKIVGPVRNSRYVSFINDKIEKYNLSDSVKVYHDVDSTTLDMFYKNADIYVQPSLEEGFCITVLDAALYGLPIVGCYAGEISNIIEKTSGCLVKPNASIIAETIRNMAKSKNTVAKEMNRTDLLDTYNWQTVTNKLFTLYGK